MMTGDFVTIHELLIKRDSSIEFSREKTDIPGVAMLVSEFLGVHIFEGTELSRYSSYSKIGK